MKELLANLKLNWKYVKDQKWKLVKYIFFNIIAVGIGIVIPILSAKAIISLTTSAFEQLILVALVIFLIEILRNITHYFVSYYAQTIYRESFVKIQTELGREILKIENKCIDANSSGVFIQRLTSDTSRMAEIFNVLNEYISGIVRDLGIFFAIFVINKTMFLYLVFMVIILYIVDHVRVKKYSEKDKIYRKKNEKISGFIGEIIRGIRDIKMLNADESFIDELEVKVKDLNQERYNMGRVNRNYNFLRGSLHDLFDFLLIALLIYFISNNILCLNF